MSQTLKTAQAIAWLDQGVVQLRLTVALGEQVEQTHSYLLTPEQARDLAGALTDYARLTEQRREC